MATPHFPLLAECRRPMQKRYVHRNLFIWSPNYYDIHINRFWNLTPKRSPKFQKNNFFFTMCSLNKKIIYVSNKFVAENTWAQYSPTYLDFVNTLKESDKNLKKANIHYYCLLFLDTKNPPLWKIKHDCLNEAILTSTSFSESVCWGEKLLGCIGVVTKTYWNMIWSWV